MAIHIWVIRTSTGEFQYGGPYNPVLPVVSVGPPVVYDANYSFVTLPDGAVPNPSLQRWNGSAIVAKTDDEIAHDVFQHQAQKHTQMSQHPDVLKMCGQLVRSRDIPVWNKMTLQAKLAAIQQEAIAYVSISQLVDSNFKE